MKSENNLKNEEFVENFRSPFVRFSSFNLEYPTDIHDALILSMDEPTIKDFAYHTIHPSSVFTIRVNLVENSIHEFSDWFLDYISEFSQRIEETGRVCDLDIQPHGTLDDVIVLHKIPPRDGLEDELLHWLDGTQEIEEEMVFSNPVVVVDRMCGEAILNGADIFARGVMTCSRGIREGDNVCVLVAINFTSVHGF